jgi:DeoR/GlpR family transcriptional regulator of sugar metabolism
LVRKVIIRKEVTKVTTISVRELSEELGISRQAVYKRINQLPKSSQPKKINGVYRLTDSIVDLIRDFEDVTTNVTTNDNQMVVIMETRINELKEVQKKLYEQLDQKDKQLHQFQTLLDQQQRLTLQTNKQIEQLQLESTINTEENTSQKNNVVSSSATEEQTEKEPPQVKKGFFSRLFKK